MSIAAASDLEETEIHHALRRLPPRCSKVHRYPRFLDIADRALEVPLDHHGPLVFRVEVYVRREAQDPLTVSQLVLEHRPCQRMGHELLVSRRTAKKERCV